MSRLAPATLTGVTAATVLATLLALTFRGLDPILSFAALLAGLATACFAFRATPAEPLRLRPWEWIATAAFALFALRAFCWVVFRQGDSIKVLSPNNLGDLSLHLTFITWFARGAPFWPENPIFATAPLHYPIGIDLFQSLLALAGAELLRSLVWVGLAASAVTLIALLRWGGAFVVFAFLCNGGLAGFELFQTRQLADFQSEHAWKSIPLALFVTQRGLLWAIPAGLLLLASWRSRFFENETPRARLPRWVEIALYASMPLFHVHTFIFLSLLLGAWLVLTPARKQIALLLASSFLPATALVLLVTGGGGASSMIHLRPGWMQAEGETFLHFWLLNFGLLPAFVLALCVTLALRWREPAARRAIAFVLPALLIFLAACFVMLAQWEWDNTKIMIWSYLVVMPFLWRELIVRWPLSARVLACAALFFSGGVSLLGGLDATHTGHKIASTSELASIARATADFPPTATYAGEPTYNHPLLLLGRKMVAGYEGHLSSHGIAYQKRWQLLQALMSGSDDWRALSRELGVRYIHWGPREEAAFPGSPQPWRAEANLVAAGPWGVIYDLAQPAGP